MRKAAAVAALSITISLGGASQAPAAGPGGWDHLGVGATPTTDAINNDVLALNTDLPGQLLVGGKFTNAGGLAAADRIAIWNGSAWSAVGPADSLGADVRAVEVAGGRIFAGGTFVNAGGNSSADYLAVWNGSAWGPFCTGSPLGGNVDALQVIGNDLYVGGEFQDGAGIASADYLLKCDLTTGASSTTTALSMPGPIYALTADANGRLYAGGNFQNLEGNSASDFVASYAAGAWSPLGSGPGNAGLVTGIVRSLAANGTDLYIGSDGNNIATLPPADHVARWDGFNWHQVGSNATGTDGFFPTTTSVFALHATSTHVYASGDWTNVGGDPLADFIADFDGGGWRTMGTNGAGNGALAAKGESLAMFNGTLHAGGAFGEAGGDPLAGFIARYTGILRPTGPLVSIGKPVINKKRGTAALAITVQAAGELTMRGKGIKPIKRLPAGGTWARPVDAAGTVTLKVKPDSKAKKKLKQKGKAKVVAEVTFTPTGGAPETEKKKLKLVKK